jgi:hypothetical protein
MFKKIKLFVQLDHKEMLLFLEAFFTLAVMRLAMLLFSFQQMTRSLEQKSDKYSVTLLPYSTIQNSLIISRVICRAANNTPWESACLLQSLCAWRMLQRRGIPGVFYLGVMTTKNSDKKMKAHAWSESGGKILTGGSGHASYSVIAVYTWRNK